MAASLLYAAERGICGALPTAPFGATLISMLHTGTERQELWQFAEGDDS